MTTSIEAAFADFPTPAEATAALGAGRVRRASATSFETVARRAAVDVRALATKAEEAHKIPLALRLRQQR